MRSIIFICTLLLFKLSFAQPSERNYTLKEVGWTIHLPAEFQIIDSADDSARNKRGKKLIEEANDIQVDISKTKTLISATKNTYNYFNSTITPYNIKKDGDYRAANQSVKDMVYKAFLEKMPDATIDSATTQQTIDGLGFDKFRVSIYLKEKMLFHMFLLTKLYKGYDFGISYLYLDEQTKQQIETMLTNSKFNK